MLRFDRYARPETPREALELLRSDRLAAIVGGMMWLRLADRTIPLGIDLSACGLDQIVETDGAFVIGAMVTLSQLERHEAFTRETCGVFADAVRDIVGTQFRNLATVGGSVWARMGFSDVVTALLVLDADVELVGAGRMPLSAFVETGAGRDVLTHVVVRRHDYRAGFSCVRNAATDFSALNAAVARWNGAWHVAVGARPQKAILVDVPPLPASYSPRQLETLLSSVADSPYGSDRRASAEYRSTVAPMLVRRALARALEEVPAC